MLKKIFVILILVMTAVHAQSQQTREEIQKRQQEIQRELNELNRNLAEIKKNRSQSVSQLRLVQRKIAAREEMISNINKELRYLDDNIYLTNLDITRYRRELDTLKQKYAKSLVFAYKNRSNYDFINFLFSANNFNDAVKRLAYLKSYRQYRETQVNHIRKTETLLQQKIAEFNNRKAEKSSTLQEQSKQLTVLEEDKKEKDQVVQELKGKEKDVYSAIRNREKERKKLQQSLAAVIKREIDAARKKEAERLAELKKKELEERAKAKNAPATPATKTPDASTGTTVSAPKKEAPKREYSLLETSTESLGQSINFEKNRGVLPWPVESGFVSGEFGTHKVPGMQIDEHNDGIIIQTPNNSTVKCVANGVVTSVMDLGEYQVVTVRHGKYFTVYSNLSSVSVQRGQDVSAGSVLGKTAMSISSGSHELNFMVMTEDQRFLNPKSWLKNVR